MHNFDIRDEIMGRAETDHDWNAENAEVPDISSNWLFIRSGNKSSLGAPLERMAIGSFCNSIAIDVDAEIAIIRNSPWKINRKTNKEQTMAIEMMIWAKAQGS